MTTDSDQPRPSRRPLWAVAVVVVIIGVLFVLRSAPKPQPAPPEASGNAPASEAPKPAPTPAPAPATLKQRVLNYEIELEAKDQATARSVLAALAASSLWQLYFDQEYALGGKRVPSPAVQARISYSADGASMTGRFEIVKPEAVTVEKTWNAPATAGAVPDLAVVLDAAALELYSRARLPKPDRQVHAERRLLEIFEKTPDGPRKDTLRTYLSALGKAGSFDAAFAALDLNAEHAAAAKLVTVDAKDYLVKPVLEQLAKEPVWALIFGLRPEPLRVAIESSVKIHKLEDMPVRIVIHGYNPGTATVKIAVRGKDDKLLYEGTTTNGTPSSVKAGEDPYKIAESTGVWLHLMEIAAKFVGELPVATKQENLLLLATQMGRLEYEKKHHKLFEAICLDAVRDNPGCQDLLVSALASRLERMDDRALKILDQIGPKSAAALVRGLSHASELVRSRCATALRTRKQEWFLPHAEEIVRRAIQTLTDADYHGACSQTAFLLRDLGPLAADALPALQAMAEKSRMSFDKEAARNAIKAIQKQ